MKRMLAMLIGMLIWVAPVIAHDLNANYVSWGVDEYELFDLTKGELKKDFKNKLFFNEDFSDACLCANTTSGPQFLLKFDKGRVSSVQRMFIDGGGCHIMGPILESKKEALQFSIEGLLSNADRLQKADVKRLVCAKESLKNLELSLKAAAQKK